MIKMPPHISYESISNALLLVQKVSSKTLLTENEHEAINDCVAAYNLGNVCYREHVQIWMSQPAGNMSQDDVEYMDSVGFVNNFIGEMCDE